MASEMESSVADSEYLISRFESAMKAWQDLSDPAIDGDLYRSPETYRLDTLEVFPAGDPARNIDEGSFGKIFRATLRMSSGVRFELHRGPWLANEARENYRVLFQAKSGEPKEEEEEIAVAVKKINGAGDMPQHELLEIIKEACNVRVLQGARNVVHVYGVTRSSELNSVCIVMELVSGSHGDLSKFLKSHDPAARGLPSWWKRKLEIFMEVVVGIQACHRHGVYHGDLKGRNVLLDKFGVPKLIDFGLSFRERDLHYLNSLGGSLFWISPEVMEVIDAPETLDEFKRMDPFPSDVYSLGMLWLEMFRDGFIPEHEDEIDDLIHRKMYAGCPVDLQRPPGLEQAVLDELSRMVNSCCQDYQNRVSLEQCLEHAHSAYSQLWKAISLNNGSPADADDLAFTSSIEYQQMLCRFRTRFPNVVEAFLEQPSKNMVVDIDGNTLLYLFCELDFGPGAEYILDRAGITWSFKPEKDVPLLCRICVRGQGSPDVLKTLSSRWRDIVMQEEWLLHEACDCQTDEVMFHLLYDLGMDFDTWHKSSRVKPLHRLAYRGNTGRMELLLDYVQQPEYVNTWLLDEFATPLSYAIEGDQVEAVFFLIERGGSLRETPPNDPHFLRELFQHAMDFWSLAVMTALLELDVELETTSNGMQLYAKVAKVFRGSHHIAPEHQAFLPFLRGFVEDCKRSGVEPFGFACSREGNPVVFELLISHWKDPIRIDRVEDRLWRSLGANGSREMVEHATRKIDMDGWAFACLCRAARKNLDVLSLLREWGKVPHTEDESRETRSPYQTGELGRAIEICDARLLSETLHKLLPDEEYTELINNLELNEVIKTGGGNAEKTMKIVIHQLRGASCSIEEREWIQMGQALLAECCFHGEKDMVTLLIGEGVELDGLEYHESVSTPLIQAVAAQDPEMVELLLKAGANPNAGLLGGETSMDIAVRCGNTKIMRLLIEYKFDTGMKDKKNATYIDKVTYMKKK